MAFDWKSLIDPAVALGSKALGDKIAPGADLQSVRNQEQQNQFNNQLALTRLAQSDQIRRMLMPGMLTALGYSPQQGQQMTASYGTPGQNPMLGSPGSTPPPASSGGGGGIGKTVANVGLSVAPAVLGSLLKGGGAGMGSLHGVPVPLGGGGGIGGALGTAGKTALGAGKAVAGAAGTAGKAALGAIGAIPLAGQIALGAGGAYMLGKKIFGDQAAQRRANELTGQGGIHDLLRNGINEIDGDQSMTPQQKEAEKRQLYADIENYLVDFSKKDNDAYYKAKETLQHFSQITGGGVKPLLG